MKKSVVLAMVFLFSVALVLAGCGSQSAGEILDQSVKKMETVESLKMKADMTNEESGKKENTQFDAVLARSEANREEYNMMITSDVAGVEETIYIVDGYQYMKLDGEWYKAPATEEDTVVDLGQLGKLAEMADEIEITSVSGDSWTLSYELGAEYFVEMMKESGEFEGEGEEFDEMMEPFVENMELNGKLRIAKSTYYLEMMNMVMDASIEGLGSFSMEITSEYSDYDKGLEVELPEEAKNAKDLPPEMQQPGSPFSDSP